MNNDYKNSRLEQFVKDEATSGAVYEVIRDAFLNRKGSRDIQIMAAERLAVELLDEAWKGLSRFKGKGEDSPPPLRQVGL